MLIAAAVVAAFGAFLWSAATGRTVPEDEFLPFHLQRVHAGRARIGQTHLIPRWVAWMGIASPFLIIGATWVLIRLF
jgi:hypothetical protein